MAGPAVGHEGLLHGRVPDTRDKAAILASIDGLRFAVATMWDPPPEGDDDDRLPFLVAAARHLDAMLFNPAWLRDAEGRVLIDAEGNRDPAARIPRPPKPPVVAPPPRATPYDEPVGPGTPSPRRVAARALALTAVAVRGSLEVQAATDPDAAAKRGRLLDWLAGLLIDREFEPDEWSRIQRPLGALHEEEAMDAAWKIESVAALAWALGRCELPRYDHASDLHEILDLVGFPDRAASLEFLGTAAELRPHEEIAGARSYHLALHWRIREHAVTGRGVNMTRFAREGVLGPLELGPLVLVNGDLALAGWPLLEAPEELLATVASATVERRAALEWLLHGGLLSDVELST